MFLLLVNVLSHLNRILMFAFDFRTEKNVYLTLLYATAMVLIYFLVLDSLYLNLLCIDHLYFVNMLSSMGDVR